jgi:hypothetical protein
MKIYAVKRVTKGGAVEWFSEDAHPDTSDPEIFRNDEAHGFFLKRDAEECRDYSSSDTTRSLVAFVPESELEAAQREAAVLRRDRDGLLALMDGTECPMNHANSWIPGFSCGEDAEDCPIEGERWCDGVGRCWQALARAETPPPADTLEAPEPPCARLPLLVTQHPDDCAEAPEPVPERCGVCDDVAYTEAHLARCGVEDDSELLPQHHVSEGPPPGDCPKRKATPGSGGGE